MRWQFRCARNTLVAALPFQLQLRALKRRVMGKAHRIHEASVYAGGFDQIKLLREAGLDLKGATVLELGTGWYPVIPLILRLAGAARIILTDEYSLLDRETLGAAVAFLNARQDDLAERLGIEARDIERALTLPESAPLDDALAALGLSYHVPTGLDGLYLQVDAVISHTVLEHIPPTVLEMIFRQSRSLLRPGGLISHGIDHSDHRQHQDPRLGRVDFLRYGKITWRLLCLNPQDYTNRLRHSDYMKMIRDVGFKITVERSLIDRATLTRLDGQLLTSHFQSYAPEDLATTWSHIVARRE